MKFRTHLLRKARCQEGGFTFLELLIVMTIMAILAAVAIPTYITNIKHARETRLRSDLWVMRQAIDKYTVDKEQAPASLEDLVSAGYLRAIPEDPIDKTAQWNPIMADTSISPDVPAGIKDVKSTAEGADGNGKPYTEY